MGRLQFVVILSIRFLLIASTVKGGTEAWKSDAAAAECVNPLGMESGKIPSSRITASSSFDVKSVGPQNARIRQELNGGAWCPRSTIEQGVKEYLEIDFDSNHRITQTETQGRFGNGMGQEFTESFQLEYWRDSLGKWVSYKDHLGRTILEANSNTYIGIIQELIPPIVASRIRFIPFSVHPRTICMRVEAYGCPFSDGLIHYEGPQGYWKKNPDVDLRDGFYDGWMDEDEVLRGGLGLLTDSLLGPHDFRSQHKNKGNMWIGWDNELQPVKIGFQFDRLRKFHHVNIHVNNLISQGVQVFASVDIYFSVDGQKFSEFPLRWVAKGELEAEKAHLVTIPLRGRLATYVRLEFFHSNHWLLLSEVSFRSDVYTGNITDDIRSLNYLQDGPEDEEAAPDAQSTKNVTTDASSKQPQGHGAMIGLIAGSLAIFALLCIVTLVCYVLRRGRRNTKLVGVMGLTPKSMSVGLGLSSCNPDALSHYPPSQSIKKGLNGNGPGKSKIALCDLKPGSRSGLTGEAESDESLYHELVFRGFGNGGIGNGGGPFSHHTVGSKNEGSTTSSTNLTSGKKSSTNKKIKYQRVNHGGDFSDFMGVRSIHDELNYFQQHSQPSTPILSQKESSTRHLAHPILVPPPPASFSRHPASSFSLKPKTSTNNNGQPLFTTTSSNGLHLGNGHYNNSPHGRRPTLSTKHAGGSSYYAATDIFHHVTPSSSDKYFERF